MQFAFLFLLGGGYLISMSHRAVVQFVGAFSALINLVLPFLFALTAETRMSCNDLENPL